MVKDFGKDYGIRPALFKNYPDMMSTVSKKAVFDVRVEPDSEFEKPYLTDDYNEQQQIHQLNFAVPYLPPASLGMSATNPTGTLPDKGNLLMDANVNPQPILLNQAGKGVGYLTMLGFNRRGLPWGIGDIKWFIVAPAKGIIVGNQYYINLYRVDASEARGTIEDNVFGVDSEGNRSNAIVKTEVGPSIDVQFEVQGGWNFYTVTLKDMLHPINLNIPWSGSRNIRTLVSTAEYPIDWETDLYINVGRYFSVRTEKDGLNLATVTCTLEDAAGHSLQLVISGDTMLLSYDGPMTCIPFPENLSLP